MRPASRRYCCIGLVACLVAGSAFFVPVRDALALTTYTTRASFYAAVGSTYTQNFESFTTNAPFHTTPVDVGDFTLSMTGSPDPSFNYIDAAPPDSAETNVHGNTNLRVATSAIPQTDLVFTFDLPTNAFGADFRSLNDGFARTRLRIDGEIVNLPVAPTAAC